MKITQLRYKIQHSDKFPMSSNDRSQGDNPLYKLPYMPLPNDIRQNKTETHIFPVLPLVDISPGDFDDPNFLRVTPDPGGEFLENGPRPLVIKFRKFVKYPTFPHTISENIIVDRFVGHVEFRENKYYLTVIHDYFHDIFYKWENNGVFSKLSKSDTYYAKIKSSLTFIYHFIVFPPYEEKQKYDDTVNVYNETYKPEEIDYGANWELGTFPFVEQNNSLLFVRNNDAIEISSFYKRILTSKNLKKKYYVRGCPYTFGFHIDSERIYKDPITENIQINENPIMDPKDIIFLFKLKHHPNFTFSKKYKQVYPPFRDNPFALSYLSGNKLSPFPLIYRFTTFIEHATVLSRRFPIKSLFILSHGRIRSNNEPIHRDFTQPHLVSQHNQELMHQFQAAIRSFASYLPTGLLLNLYQYPLYTHTGTIYTENYNNIIDVEIYDFFQDDMESLKIHCWVTLFPVIACIHDDKYVPDFAGGNIPGFYVKFDDDNIVGYYMDCYVNLDYLVAYNLTNIQGYDTENTQYPVVEYQPLGNADITWGYVPTFLHRFKQLFSSQNLPYYPFPNFQKYYQVYLESNIGYAHNHELTREEAQPVLEFDSSIERSESGLRSEVIMEEEKSIELEATVKEDESIIEHETTMEGISVIEHEVSMEGDEPITERDVTEEGTDYVVQVEATENILENKGKRGRRIKNKSKKEMTEIIEEFIPKENKNKIFDHLRYFVDMERNRENREKQKEKEKMEIKAKKAQARQLQGTSEVPSKSQIEENNSENREIPPQSRIEENTTENREIPSQSRIEENTSENREIVQEETVPTTEGPKFEIVSIPKSSEKRIIYKRESIEDDVTFMRDYNKILRKNRKKREFIDNPLNNYISADTPREYKKKITTTHWEEVIYPSYVQDTIIEARKNAKFETQQDTRIGDIDLCSGDKLKLREVMMSVTRKYNQNMEDFFERVKLGLIPEDEEPPEHKENRKIDVMRREETPNEGNVDKSREMLKESKESDNELRGKSTEVDENRLHPKGLNITNKLGIEKIENKVIKPVEKIEIVQTEKEPPKIERALKWQTPRQIAEPKVVESSQTETSKKELKVSKNEKSQQSATATEEKTNVLPLPSTREMEILQRKLESEIMTAVEFVKKQVPNNTIHQILTCEETSTDINEDDFLMYDCGRSRVLKSVSQMGGIPDKPPKVQIIRSETKEEIEQRKLEELQSQLKNEILDSVELIYQNTPKEIIKEILTGQGDDIQSLSPPEFPKRQPRSLKDTAESPIEIVSLIPSERYSTKVIKKPKENPERQGKLSLFFEESEAEDELSTSTVETDESTNESTDSCGDNFFCFDKKLLEDIYPMEYVDKLKKKVYEREFERNFDES